MIKTMISVLTASMLVFSSGAFAQRAQTQTGAPAGPNKHLSTIVFAGVAGAILGLSTLSFYGRPQEKLSHIAIGAAIGIIVGASYTTFKAATEPKDFYSLRSNGPQAEAWSLASESRERSEAYTPRANFSFSF